MTHSKEPWRQGKAYNAIVSDDACGPMVNGAEAVAHYGGYMVAESVAEENRRRIVACVNACAGLDTELLENIAMLGDTLKDRIDALRTEANQRDQLRAALVAMLEIHGVTQKYADTHIEIPQSWVEVSDIARAALAATEDKQ